jgi:hypothetical protein
MTVQGTLRMAEPPARQRTPRSYWLAGSALLLVVVLLLAGAFLLDRQFRPRVGIETGSGVATGAITAPSRTITTEAEIGQLATPLERELAAAYLRYWEVYAHAVESLGPARLTQVADGERLEEAQAEVANLRTSGRAAKIQVRHSFIILRASGSEATIRDQYVNSSYLIDPTTKQPIGTPGQSQTAVVTYTLRRVDGTWKVVEAVREAT